MLPLKLSSIQETYDKGSLFSRQPLLVHAKSFNCQEGVWLTNFCIRAQTGTDSNRRALAQAGAKYLVGRNSIAFPVCEEQPTAFNHTNMYWLDEDQNT